MQSQTARLVMLCLPVARAAAGVAMPLPQARLLAAVERCAQMSLARATTAAVRRVRCGCSRHDMPHSSDSIRRGLLCETALFERLTSGNRLCTGRSLPQPCRAHMPTALSAGAVDGSGCSGGSSCSGDLLTDSYNCGSCGKPCPLGEVCRGGTCQSPSASCLAGGG